MLEHPLSPPADEEAYRKHFLRSDALQASLVMALYSLAIVAFAKNDWILFGASKQFYLLVANRIVLMGLVVSAIGVFLRSKTPRTHDQAIIAFLLFDAISSFYILSTRPPEYIGHASTLLMAVIVYYFVLPGPLGWRTAATVLTSIRVFIFTLNAAGPVIGRNAAIITHVLTHLVGFPIALRMAKLRRERFQAQLAEERTRKQLEIAKDRAERLARAKSDFLATMSHEFRTPMNAVLGLSEVLSHSALTSEQRDAVKTIHKSADSLLVLLNDILDHAKIDSGRMTFEKAPIDIRDLAEAALATVRYKATEKRIILELSTSADIPAGILGDSARIRQVLVNLLSNATKFTDAGKVSLHVTARRIDDKQHELHFRVEDTGIGISKEDLERIFSPFEQAAVNLNKGYGGTGLGLSISRSLAELMGGSLRAESTVGKGSVFDFSLTAEEAEAPAKHMETEILRLAEKMPLRILIAEDNATNQRVAIAMLGQLGYGADIVANGRLAIEALQQNRYDVVFMDRHMPVLDGIEATKLIRSEPPGDERPYIVAMTASAFADDRAVCRAAGMDDFVSKPMRISDLRSALSKAFHTSSRQHQNLPALDPNTTGRDDIALLDAQPLEQLRALESVGEPGFFQSLCREFITETQSRIALLPDLLTARDAKTLEREAHSMKSASASLGAMKLSELCSQLERTAREEKLDECGVLIEELRAEFPRVQRALEREIN